MVMSKENYEDLRNKRMEEIKKRMEELNLPQLARALKTTHSPKPSRMKKRAKPRVIGTEMVEVRRSSRVASSPAPVYKKIVVYERVTMIKSGGKYASDEARYWPTTKKAEEIEASLEGGYPSLVKPMLQSYRYCLPLPSDFCRENLPKNDAIITLIDEEGDEVPTKYLAYKDAFRLSRGWNGFSTSHELVCGDALVFQLVEPTVFKVYIIRCKGYEEGENNEALEA